jgi:hypothetical protein
MDSDDIANSAAPLDGAVPHLFRSISFLAPRVGLFIGLAIVLASQYARSSWRKVPPGPRGLPILGNALELQDKAWLFGKDCKRKFGASGFISVNHKNPEVYKTHPRAYNVLECSWPAHSRLQ